MISHYRDCEKEKLVSLFRERFRNMSVLDLGCGDGRIIPLMKAAGCAVTGVDRDPGQLQGIECVDIHGSDWQPELDSFDVILASHVIEHLAPKELCAFMDKWLGALKPGGHLVVLTPVLGERFYYDFTHIRPYYPQSLRMMFRGLNTSMAFSCKWRMELEDIWFFRDPFRLRMARGFYPSSSASPAAKAAINHANRALDSLYRMTSGRIGRLASWMGIYGKIS